MNNEILIETDKPLTLETYTSIASDIMSSIGKAAEDINEIDEIFSVADLSYLLNKMSVHMPGEFEVHRTPSHYCQIVYKPYTPDESEFDEEQAIQSSFSDTHGDPSSCLWINERVFRAFVDRKFYGIAFALYFYLGYLMTRDESFAVSHKISFEEIVESCDAFLEGHLVKHPTTLMRALADLQDAGFIKWHAKPRTFELLYITPYDPLQKV